MEVLKTITSADGKRRAEIQFIDEGLYRFTEEAEIWADGYEDYPGAWTWSCQHFSGYYDTAAAAEAGAQGELPWLRDMD